MRGNTEQKSRLHGLNLTQGGLPTPLTKWQAFFFGVRFPSESIHPKDHVHLVSADLDPPDKRAQHLTCAMPCECLQVLRHLGRNLLHTANDQLEFPLQRLGFGELVTVGFDVRHALTQSGHARLECLFFTQALRRAIDEPCQALAELAHLAL